MTSLMLTADHDIYPVPMKHQNDIRICMSRVNSLSLPAYPVVLTVVA